MTRFEIACIEDAVQLSEVQKRAFDSQVPDHMPDLGGPPGYDSVEWQIETMQQTPYIKIRQDGAIVGGIVLEPQGPDHCHVGRIFLDPPFHGLGIGTQAFAWLEKTYPQVTLWTLRTPSYHTRNQRFYERLGYRRTGKDIEVFPGFVLVGFEKRIEVEP
jgi:RimJ/RimL family protein N-acetyltransferase